MSSLQHADPDYTTNVALSRRLLGGTTRWVACQARRRADLEHRSWRPDARLVLPQALLLEERQVAVAASSSSLVNHAEQGFWERNGYHDRGDPWTEQRYQGD